MIGLCFIIKRNSHVLEQAFKGVFHLNGYCCLDFYCWQRKPKGVNEKKNNYGHLAMLFLALLYPSNSISYSLFFLQMTNNLI